MREGELSAGRAFVTWRLEFFPSFILLIYDFSIGNVSLLLFLQFTNQVSLCYSKTILYLTNRVPCLYLSWLLCYMKSKFNLLLLLSLQNLHGISLLCKGKMSVGILYIFCWNVGILCLAVEVWNYALN